MLLYSTGLVAVSRLSHRIACRANPPAGWAAAPLQGLCADTAKGTLWAWGAAGVLRVRTVREERHVWRLHLEASNFEAALSYASPTDAAAAVVVVVLTRRRRHASQTWQVRLADGRPAARSDPHSTSRLRV